MPSVLLNARRGCNGRSEAHGFIRHCFRYSFSVLPCKHYRGAWRMPVELSSSRLGRDAFLASRFVIPDGRYSEKRASLRGPCEPPSTGTRVGCVASAQHPGASRLKYNAKPKASRAHLKVLACQCCCIYLPRGGSRVDECACGGTLLVSIPSIPVSDLNGKMQCPPCSWF